MPIHANLKPTVRRGHQRATYMYVRSCTYTHSARGGPRRTVGFKLAWIGTDQPLHSNCIVLYVAKREYLYLVCSFKKTAPPQTGYARRRQRIYLDK